MKLAIFTDEVGWHTRQLQAALRARGAVGRCVDLADCHAHTRASDHGLVIPGFGCELPAAALVRGIAGGSFEQVTRRLALLHALQALGVPVYNDARAIERSADKGMCSLLLHAAGIASPPTWVTESLAQAQRIVMRESAAGHALVLKPLFGSQGKGLRRVGWVDGRQVPLLRVQPPGAGRRGGAKAGAALPGGVGYLQRYLAPHTRPGYDWRVLVIGGRARAAMRRVSGHWIHNIAQGAVATACLLTPELARLSERATQALGLDYAGVDLMPDTRTGEAQVIEVNGVAAWRGLQGVCGFNIAQALVDDLLARRLAECGAAPWAGLRERA